MINRTMVRTRVVQTLFAYYKNPGNTTLTARKELLKSFADTYDLYCTLLDFANVLTAYAQQQIEEKAGPHLRRHPDQKGGQGQRDGFDEWPIRAQRHAVG